jgi:flagellar motor protein MotB
MIKVGDEPTLVCLDSPEGRASNRRVAIVVVASDPAPD